MIERSTVRCEYQIQKQVGGMMGGIEYQVQKWSGRDDAAKTLNKSKYYLKLISLPNSM